MRAHIYFFICYPAYLHFPQFPRLFHTQMHRYSWPQNANSQHDDDHAHVQRSLAVSCTATPTPAPTPPPLWTAVRGTATANNNAKCKYAIKANGKRTEKRQQNTKKKVLKEINNLNAKLDGEIPNKIPYKYIIHIQRVSYRYRYSCLNIIDLK